MNRSERKKLEKQLGLTKHYKSFSLSKKLEKMRSNQENGRKLEEEMKNRVNLSIQEQMEAIESKQIEELALTISQNENIPLIKALGLAKERLNKTKK